MKKGNSNLEIIMSMVLLTLFTICIFVLIATGNNTEEKIIVQNEIKNNARIASSYINVKLKQNDISNKIMIKENPNTQRDALVIQEGMLQKKTDTWIYYDQGYLLECVTDSNSSPTNDVATKIAKVDGFTVSMEDQKIKSYISYFYNNEPHTVEQIVVLRSK